MTCHVVFAGLFHVLGLQKILVILSLKRGPQAVLPIADFLRGPQAVLPIADLCWCWSGLAIVFHDVFTATFFFRDVFFCDVVVLNGFPRCFFCDVFPRRFFPR